MKKMFLTITVVSAIFLLNACGEKKDDSKKVDAENTEESGDQSTESTDDSNESETVECEGPMMDFMAMMDGSTESVSAALDKYGQEGLDRVDMDMYKLEEAKVVSCSKGDVGECCTMEAKSGVTIRTYDVCWEGDKIVSIVEKGMR